MIELDNGAIALFTIQHFVLTPGPMRHNRCFPLRAINLPRLLLCGGLCLTALPVQADKIHLELQGVSGALLDNVRAYLALEQQKEQPQLSAIRIKRLYAQAPDNIRHALQAYGYYRPLIDTELLPPVAPDHTWRVRLRIDPRDAVRLHRVELELTGDAAEDPAFQAWRSSFPLHPHDVFSHAPYETAKKQLLRLAEERGYFQATLEQHEVLIDEQAYTARLFLRFASGPRYRFGTLRFQQQSYRFADSLLNHFTPFEPGQFYNTSDLLTLQTALSGSDYFSEVQLNTHKRSDTAPPQVDIEAITTARRRDSYRGRVGYGTDTGLRLSVDAGFRYLNSHGHRLQPSIGWTQNRNRYLANLRYLLPTGQIGENFLEGNLLYKAEDFNSEDIGSNSAAEAERIQGTTRVEDLNLGIARHQQRNLWGFKLDEVWSLNYLLERYELLPLLFTPDEQNLLETLEANPNEGINLTPLRPDFKVLYAGMRWVYTQSDDRFYTHHGEQLSFSIKAAQASLGSNISFWQARLDGTVIRSLGARDRLIARANLAYTEAETLTVLGAINTNNLPKALQFRTGGDHSLRGYKYEALSGGSQTLVGGKHLLVGSLEYEHRWLEAWSSAVFVDAGNVFNEWQQFKAEASLGLGLRWHSPVGLVRLDFGYGLTATESWRIHLVIGPDF